MDGSSFGFDYSWTILIAGVIVTVCAALDCYWWNKRIAQVSEIIVPFMAVLYISVAIIILVNNYTLIPTALSTIIMSAFGLKAVAGGALDLLW